MLFNVMLENKSCLSVNVVFFRLASTTLPNLPTQKHGRNNSISNSGCLPDGGLIPKHLAAIGRILYGVHPQYSTNIIIISFFKEQTVRSIMTSVQA